MYELKYEYNNEVKTLNFIPGLSVKEILDTTNTRLPSACQGFGACGLCKIIVNSDNVPEPTETEKYHLSIQELKLNIRLGCQIKPQNNLDITLMRKAKGSKWKSIGLNRYRTAISEFHFDLEKQSTITKQTLGLAIDLGTTNISLLVINLSNNKQITDRMGHNPQARFGSDIISRLNLAVENKKLLSEMSQLVIHFIADGLKDIANREGIILRDITQVILVGNSAMLSILSQDKTELLIQPEYWTKAINFDHNLTKHWIETWKIHEKASIKLIQPLAGFLGSDIITGIISSQLSKNKNPSMLIDFGTNSEIALFANGKYYITSVAGGPAFEGMGIGIGMPAEKGAVYSLSIDANEEWNYKVIDDEKAFGICGSGLIDLIAQLLINNKIDSMGNFSNKKNEFQFHLNNDQSFILKKRDIDIIQRAKASIGVGISVLCNCADISIRDINRLCISGVFGKFLNIDHAKQLGLIPSIDISYIELIHNSALFGAIDILISELTQEVLNNIRTNNKIINLSNIDNYDELFLDHLYLKPMDI